MRLLQLAGVSRRFVSRAETVTAVDTVTLTVEPGTVTAIAGPSGSGKSTLLHLILGWELPDEGSVSVDVGAARGWAGVAVIPQELGLLAELTVQQNVELAVRLSSCSGTSEPLDVAPLFESLGLSDLTHRLPTELSMGEQQRAAVARAIAASPMLLIADEPTAHQDERNADAVMSLLSDVGRRRGAVLVATHDERVLETVDEVVQLVDGRIVAADDSTG